MISKLAILVLFLALVDIVIGAIFVFEGVSKNNLITQRMATENVSLALDPSNPQQFTIIRTGADAQQAADTIAGHRRSIAPSYQALLGSGQFDPTNSKDLVYAQAMNLENYLYMAVVAFGLIQVTEGAGVFMLSTGIAIGGMGLALLVLSRKAA
jgi:hypothetical protein